MEEGPTDPAPMRRKGTVTQTRRGGGAPLTPPARRVLRFGGMLAAALALAAACNAPGAAPTITGSPAPTSPPPTPIPTSTPVPELLLIGEASPGLRASLHDWATQRGWRLREASAGDPAAHTAAVVLSDGGEAALPALAESSLPIVTVDLPAAVPGQHLSTVGEPGARHDQAGFLAGSLAALATRSSQVGLITDPGGVYPQAFLHGLRYLCVRCTLIELAPEAAGADAFRAKRVDVIGVAPGAAARGAAESLAGSGFRWTLVDQPGEAFPPGEVTGLVVFDPEPLVIAALEALLEGEPSRAWPYAVELDGLAVVDLDAGLVTPGRHAALQAILEALRDGSLDPGTGQSRSENPLP